MAGLAAIAVDFPCGDCRQADAPPVNASQGIAVVHARNRTQEAGLRPGRMWPQDHRQRH
jgi:hypothetical protein